MSRETVLRNARIVLDDEVLHGSVLIRDGLVADISPAPPARSAAPETTSTATS